MDNYKIWLDGISNEYAGVRLQGAVKISAPEPNVTTVSVPGRNGDLHYADGTYKNRTATVGAYVYCDDAVKSAFNRVYRWLFDSFGYRKLVTDDDRAHYMLARVKNGAEIDARIRKIAPFEIKFDCMPQRFLFAGDEPIEINANMTLENPTIFPSLPLYKVYGSGEGTLTVGAHTAIFSAIDGYIYYDAETQNAYKGTANHNANVYCPYALVFERGEQPINFAGGITNIEITPRWWEL